MYVGYQFRWNDSGRVPREGTNEEKRKGCTKNIGGRKFQAGSRGNSSNVLEILGIARELGPGEEK